MPERIARIVRYAVIALLALVLLVRGIVPAFTTIDTDFPNYYTASRLVLEGKDVSRLYDDVWFKQQIASYGISVDGKFSPFPPPTILIMLPIAWLSPRTAMTVWTILNMFTLAVMMVLVQRTTRKSLWWVSLLILFTGHGLINDFRFGQCYLILALGLLLGYRSWSWNNPLAAGVLLGAGASIKYFPLVYIPLMILREEWKLLLTFILCVAALNGVTLAIVGTGVYEEFFKNIFMNHLSANMQDQFSSAFQSWQSLFRRLFVGDDLLNPSPLFLWPAGFVVLTSLVVATVILIAASEAWQLQRIGDETSFPLQFSLLTIAGLTILPASATYHFLLLMLPVALLISTAASSPSRYHTWLALAYAALGFIPYHLVRGFDGQGFLTVLAYPRLWLMTIIFIVTVAYLRKIGRPSGMPITNVIPNHL